MLDINNMRDLTPEEKEQTMQYVENISESLKPGMNFFDTLRSDNKKDKTIYTSYFAKIKSLPDNVIPIAICDGIPDWYKGLWYKKLAPKWSFFKVWKENHDNDYYIEHFNKEVLNLINPHEVIRELQMLIGKDNSDKDICLICYEKPSDFCHRHLVANWLNENGYNCKEYTFN